MTNSKRPASAANSRKSDVKASSKRSSVKNSKRPSSAVVSNKSEKTNKSKQNAFNIPYGLNSNHQSLKYITSYNNNNDWLKNGELRNQLANSYCRAKSKKSSMQNCINHNQELVYNSKAPGGEIFLAGGIHLSDQNL